MWGRLATVGNLPHVGKNRCGPQRDLVAEALEAAENYFRPPMTGDERQLVIVFNPRLSVFVGGHTDLFRPR
jgi:hypothetical protein